MFCMLQNSWPLAPLGASPPLQPHRAGVPDDLDERDNLPCVP